MRFPFCRNRDFLKNGTLISIRRTGDGFCPGLFINAAVSQEYYIDALEQRIEKIITDLSDCNYKAGLANLMSANGCSLEDAKEQIDPDDFEQRETLEILSYDIDTIDIKW